MKKILFFIVFLLLSTPSHASFGACAFGDCDSGGVGEFTTLTSGELSVTEDSVVGIGTLTPDPRNILTLNGDLFLKSPDGITGTWGTSIDLFNGGNGAVIVRDADANGMLGVRSFTGGYTGYISHNDTNMIIGTDQGQVSFSDVIRVSVGSATIASNGAGTHATLTLTPSVSGSAITCNDTDGCDITLGETGMQNGSMLWVHNIGSNSIYFVPASGVLSMPYNIVLDDDDMAFFQYENSQWVFVTAKISHPTAQTIAGGDTVADDACNGMKQISSAGAVTTSTSATFTTAASRNRGCAMDVCNTGANNITLDNNADFNSTGGLDVLLTPLDCIRVRSNGTDWYQITPISVN